MRANGSKQRCPSLWRTHISNFLREIADEFLFFFLTKKIEDKFNFFLVETTFVRLRSTLDLPNCTLFVVDGCEFFVCKKRLFDLVLVQKYILLRVLCLAENDDVKLLLVS